MNIVHLIFALNTGGAETMLIDIVNEQVKTESVSIIIINQTFNQSLINQIDDHVNIVFINRKKKSRSFMPILVLNWKLLLINPDVIHCHQHSAIRLLFRRKRVYFTAHNEFIPTTNLKLYQRVFAISKSVKASIEDRCDITTSLVYNGINTDKIKQKEDYNFKSFKIIQVGRLDHKNKGQHVLLEAMKILIYKKHIKNIYVDFIGDGDSLHYLKELSIKYDLVEFVNFKGIKDRSYIYEYLKDYNLLVQPSLFEGFGLTIAEAMAAKVPVLISNIEGPVEVINNGTLGAVFQTGNATDLANKIYQVFNDPDQKLIEQAYNYAVDNYQVKTMVSNYSKLYHY